MYDEEITKLKALEEKQKSLFSKHCGTKLYKMLSTNPTSIKDIDGCVELLFRQINIDKKKDLKSRHNHRVLDGQSKTLHDQHQKQVHP